MRGRPSRAMGIVITLRGQANALVGITPPSIGLQHGLDHRASYDHAASVYNSVACQRFRFSNIVERVLLRWGCTCLG